MTIHDSTDDRSESESATPASDAPEPHQEKPLKSVSPLQRLVRTVALDVTPLRRHRDYRLLYIGQLVSFFGNMITSVAVPYQAYTLTGSPLAVGLFGVVQLVPLLVLAFVGGALADAFDRRRLVQLTELSLAILTGVLLVNALLPHPMLWLL